MITGIGIALRVIYTQQTPAPAAVGDPWFYHQTAKALVEGRGYAGSQTYHTVGATAEHPPLYSLLVAAITALGGKSEATQRLVASLVTGAALMAAVAYLARRVAGARVGLIAAAIAAVCPTLIAAEASGESEALFGLLAALVLLSAYRLLATESLRDALLLGLWIGLATLTRSDAALFLVIPLVMLARSRASPPWRATAASVLITVVVICPWLIRNWADFGRPTLSTNVGTLVAGTNCPSAYYGPAAGAFRLDCIYPPQTGNELDRSDALVDRGTAYARHHSSRLPYLFGIRFLDVWGLRSRNFEFNIYAATRDFQRLERDFYGPLLVLAGVGLIVLLRRRMLLWPLLVPLGMTSLIAVLSWGSARFRHASEVVMVVLAAVALELVATTVANRARRPRAGQPRQG